MRLARVILLLQPLLVLEAPRLAAQEQGREIGAQVEALVGRAYESAANGLPCKVKTRGRPRMLRWEEVDRCLNDAAGRVDWEEISRALEAIRGGARGVSAGDFAGVVDAALSARALVFDRVFAVKESEVLLPLTNSLLKYLPADSLHDLVVIDKVGTRVGTFLGSYSYERAGGLSSANSYRLSLFQYTDTAGNAQSASEKLLLDSFGVPWKDAKDQRGFRLNR